MIIVENILEGYSAKEARHSPYPMSSKNVVIESAYNTKYVIINIGKEAVAVVLSEISAALVNALNTANKL